MGNAKTVIYYKIRSKSNPEMFHKGGIYENWSKNGKVWATLGQLRSMLTMNMTHYNPTDMSDWEIIEYEVTEKSVKAVHELVSQKRLIEMLKK